LSTSNVYQVVQSILFQEITEINVMCWFDTCIWLLSI